MKLLDRSESAHKPTRSKSAKIVDTTPFRPAAHQRWPSLHDRDNATWPRDTNKLRPQTADNIIRNSKPVRLSFFEAFAIDADTDTFSFPKPSSAKTVPKEFELLAALIPSREASPMIGVALGSPSRPPQQWDRLPSFGPGSAKGTPRTPRFTESFDVEPPPVVVRPTPTRPTTTPAWKRVGSLFRRATKTAKSDSSNDVAKAPIRSKTDSPEQRPPTSTGSSRPKSRGRMMFTRQTKPKELYNESWPVDSKVDLGLNHIVRATEIRVSSEAWRTAFRTPKQRPARPWTSSNSPRTGDASRINLVPLNADANIAQPKSSPLPRLELQLPSCQLERYSVMFEKLLDPKPTLLERRQSRLRMLDMNLEEKVGTTQGLPLLAQPASINANLRQETPLVRRATSPSYPAQDKSQNPKTMLFHKPLPPIRRSKTSPLPQVSPEIPTVVKPQLPQSFVESPVSTDEDEQALPRTPPQSTSVRPLCVLTDTIAHLDVPVTKETTNVWHAVLPAPPGSSTSSRFSIDVHRALESPRLFNRSQSCSGIDMTPRPIVQQVQVAVARQVRVSQNWRAIQLGSPRHMSLRPKVIQVGESRKTAMLETSNDTR